MAVNTAGYFQLNYPWVTDLVNQQPVPANIRSFDEWVSVLLIPDPQMLVDIMTEYPGWFTEVAAGAMVTSFWDYQATAPRTGAVTAQASDYPASYIDNDSINVSGSTVADALDTLFALLGSNVYWVEPVQYASASPPAWSDGERCLVSGTGTGIFAGHDYEIATATAGGTAATFEPMIAGAVVSLDGAGVFYRYNGINLDALQFATVFDFTDLGDVPASYAGEALKLVRVNAGETGLEFVAAGGSVLPGNTHAVYVSKIGDDANDGLNIDRSKLTIQSAITAASALISGGATQVAVIVRDAGTYTGDIIIPSGVHVDARYATLDGAADMGPGGSLWVDTHYPSSGGAIDVCVARTTGSGVSHYKARVMDTRGPGGAETDVFGCYVDGPASDHILFMDVDLVYVGENSVGFYDELISGSGGHVHFSVRDLYLTGNNATGIKVTGSSANFIGYVDHILERGSPTGTIAIQVSNAAADVRITANQIIADTAYNITAGDLWLSCPDITGTRTGTPVYDSSRLVPISGAGAPGVATGDTYPVGTLYVDTAADKTYILVDNTAGANVWEDANPAVQDGDIDSEAATNGQVLTADGAGGASWQSPAPTPWDMTIAVSDETTALTTGTGKVTFRMPRAVTLTAVRASVTTAPTGSAIEVDINEGGVSILSTVISIDATEKTSTTAATPPVISDASLADDAEMTIDIDQVGSTVAGAGLKVTLIGTIA